MLGRFSLRPPAIPHEVLGKPHGNQTWLGNPLEMEAFNGKIIYKMKKILHV